MNKFTFLLVLGVSVSYAHGASVNSVIDFDETNPDLKKKSEHQKFFQTLNFDEREWIIRLAIKQERDELIQKSPISIIPILTGPRGSSLGQNAREPYNSIRKGDIDEENEIKPIDTLDMVPTGLFQHLLNGKISSQFQKTLVKWLRDSYGFQDAHFLNFSSKSDQFCQDGKCWDIGDIGGECCPFG